MCRIVGMSYNYKLKSGKENKSCQSGNRNSQTPFYYRVFSYNGLSQVFYFLLTAG